MRYNKKIQRMLLLGLIIPLWVAAQTDAKPLRVQFTDGTSELVRGLTVEDHAISDSSVVVNAIYKTIEISCIEDVCRKDFGQFPDNFARQAKEKFGVFLEYAVYDKNSEYDWNNHRRACEHTVQGVLYQNKNWIRATDSFNAMLKNRKQKTEQWRQDAINPNRKKPLYVDVWLLSVRNGAEISKYIVFDDFRD